MKAVTFGYLILAVCGVGSIAAAYLVGRMLFG